jgi:hypothetical protein
MINRTTEFASILASLPPPPATAASHPPPSEARAAFVKAACAIDGEIRCMQWFMQILRWGGGGGGGLAADSPPPPPPRPPPPPPALPQIRQLSFWLYRFGVTIWLRDMQRQLQALNSKVPLSCSYKQNHKPLMSIKVLATSLWADPAAEITVLTTKIQVSWELELPGRGGWEGWGGGRGGRGREVYAQSLSHQPHSCRKRCRTSPRSSTAWTYSCLRRAP